MTTKNPSSETSLSLVLKTLCGDHELADLTLEGTNGEKIQVNRCILAARSIFFRRMLFGQYRESEDSVIPIGYDGKILKAIKEYCYTDHADILDESLCDESWVRTMMQLACASDYCGLPMLQKKVLDIIRSKMKNKPSLSCVILENAEEVGGDAAQEFIKMAMEMIRSKTKDSLLPPGLSRFNGVTSLKQETLTNILQDGKLDADEIVVFRALKAWSDGGNELLLGKENSTSSRSSKRKDRAVEMMKHVNLKRIKPSDLTSYVKPSGLATSDQLMEAFEAHKQLWGRSTNHCSMQTMRWPTWDLSNNIVFECKDMKCRTALLKHDPMVSGVVYTWAIETKKFVNRLDEVGVARVDRFQSVMMRNEWLSQRPEIGFMHSLQKGENVITFSLDLTASGTLTASVDGENPFELFDNLLLDNNAVDSARPPSFLPAVSLLPGASVKFLGFQ